MTIRTLVYIGSTFGAYRIPVFNAMHRLLGDGFTVVALSRPKALAHHPTYEGVVDNGIFQLKIVRGIYVPLWSRKTSLGHRTPITFDFAPGVALILSKLNPDVVVSNNYGLWTLQSLAFGHSTVIYWQGTAHTERTVQPWRRRLRRWMSKRAKAFVVNGSAARSYLIEDLNVSRNRIFLGGTCPEPVPERFKPATARRVQTEQPIRFLFVGRLIKGKGPQYLLQAAAHLKASLPLHSPFELIFVGDGPEREDLLACALRLELNARFVGMIPTREVWNYYAKAHILVLPTLHDNWPLVVPEAMSMGLSILVSKFAGSVPDLIREGKNGFSFDPEDHECLATLMGRYIENPDLVENHGAHSLKLVAQYNPEHMANILLTAAEYAMTAKD